MAANIVLWDDNPSTVDLLGFDAVVVPVMQAIRARELDPVTIGIHAPWGGGKSTVLGLIADAIGSDSDYLVVRTDPWEYDDQTDVKGTVIAEVLGALDERFGETADLKTKTKGLLKRISWSRIGIALANGALTMQWDAEKLIDAFTPRTTAPTALLDESVTHQCTGHRRAPRNIGARLRQVPHDRARTPSRIRATQLQNPRLDLGRDLMRARPWT